MTDVSIPEMMYTMMSLLFLLLGIVLVASIVMSTVNPYDQVAFANAERLRATIDQSCIGIKSTVKFELPQNTPALTNVLTVMPIWLINTNGDPNYVIYHEGFPPGDAVGWEVYQNMQNRLVAYLPDGFTGSGGGDPTSDDVIKYVKEVQDRAKAKNVGLIEGVVIGNIVINKIRSDFHLGENQKSTAPSSGAIGIREDELRKNIEAYGEWKDTDNDGVPDSGDNYFKFNNYLGMNSFQKSAAKYMPCGDNSLCLKTRSGVYKMQLNEACKNMRVQLIYDETAAGGKEKLLKTAGLDTLQFGGLSIVRLIFNKIGGLLQLLTVGSLVKDLAAYELGVKVGDFDISSPCNIREATVEQGVCSSFFYDRSEYFDPSSGFNPCTNVMTYPIYEYSGNVLKKTAGTRSVCVEKIDDRIDSVSFPSVPNEQCINVFVKSKTGYCWTPDLYKKTTWSGFFLNRQEFVAALTSFLDVTPVRDHAGIISASTGDESMIVLKPTDIAMKAGAKFYEALGRKWWWGWPG